MKDQALRSMPLTSNFHCGRELNCSECTVKPCQNTIAVQEAVRLIEAGARATLICQLTHLPTKTVKRLYRMLTGHSAPQGQMPFSDTWYRENDRRMLHATIIWQLHSHINSGPKTHLAKALLDIYHAYIRLVERPLLDLTRVFFVLRLVSMNLFHERKCTECEKPFLASIDEKPGCLCPACRLYFRFRCVKCKAFLNAKALGRPRTVCIQCK